MNRGAIPLVATLLATALPRPAGASDACDTSPCDHVQCLHERTRCLIDEGEPARAVELLLEEADTFGQDRDHHLLLAAAYLADDDTAGMLETLDAYISEHPDDCEALSWLAWNYMDHAFTALTTEILENEKCTQGSGPMALRFGLLSAFLHVKEEKGGESGFHELEVDEIYEEDIQLYRYLRSVESPHYSPPFFIRFALQAGYTTNAMFGSASDPAMQNRRMDSPLLGHELQLGYAPMIAPFFSPSVELSSSSFVFLFESESRAPREERAASADPLDFSSFDFGVRAGLRFLWPHHVHPSLFVGYRGDALFLNMEDQYDFTPPVAFYEGHRAEIEIAPIASVILFGGWGRRFFREDIRTRWELDGGVGLQRAVLPWLSLLGAASVRKHWAENEAYNVVGASVLGQMVFHVYRGIQVKAMLALHLDHYADSAGFFHETLTRRDTTIKASAEFLTMSLKGVRFAVSYEFSDRFSSAPDWGFLDHRVLAKVSLYYGLDFLGARKSDEEHVPLDYGLEVSATGEIQGIQDLLRTDETMRGGPGCGCIE